MTNIVLLDNVDHADLRVTAGYSAEFGDAVNQTRVFPGEFEALQREYPIVFRRTDGGFSSVVLLGLDRDENLFLRKGGWAARYVPAAHRRGPFSIGVQSGALAGEPEAKINVDLDHARIGRPDGDLIFLRHGGAAPCLNAANDALAVVYDGLRRETAMFQAFETYGLIEPVEIGITVGEGRRYDLDDVHALSRARLAALDAEALATLHHDGWLAAALHAASSLGNIDHLIALKTRKVPAS